MKKIENISSIIIWSFVVILVAFLVFVAGLAIGQHRVESENTNANPNFTIKVLQKNSAGVLNYEITSSAIASLLSVIVALLGIWITTNKSRAKTANRDTYLRLEMASIDLFRFEAANIEITKPLWENVSAPANNTAKGNAFFNYVCQNLNLIEMAIEFHSDKIINTEEMYTWFAWIFDLSNAPGFNLQWKRARGNYSLKLNKVIECCKGSIEEGKEKSIEEKKQIFYKEIEKIDEKYIGAFKYYEEANRKI